MERLEKYLNKIQKDFLMLLIEIAGFFSFWITDVIFNISVGNEVSLFSIAMGFGIIILFVTACINYSKPRLYVISFVVHLLVIIAVITWAVVDSWDTKAFLICVLGDLQVIGIVFFLVSPVGYLFFYNTVSGLIHIIKRKSKKVFESNFRKMLPGFIIWLFIVCVWTCVGSYCIDDHNKSMEMTSREHCARETLDNSFVYDGDYAYPDDYAGTYGEGYKMYVLVTDEGSIEYYSDLLSEYNDFIEYKVVTYSYNYLDEHMDELEQKIRKDTDGYKGARCEVDVEQNKGHIVLFCDNYDEIVEKYADDEAVYFENGYL